jgi:hypothetical protein
VWAVKTHIFNKQTGVNMKNQPAFPQPEQIFNEFHPNYGKDRGMTLRDYFAAKAMQGSIAGTPHNVDIEPTELATWCYIMADRMLKARQE